MTDMVNNPDHYNQGDIECIDAIRAMLTDEEFIGYLRGNSLKYRWRFRYKNGIEDLRKAEWYEKKLLKTFANALISLDIKFAWIVKSFCSANCIRPSIFRDLVY